jgi:hypothetical protein
MSCTNLGFDLKMALDPVLWAKSELHFEPDPWQAEVLRSQSPRILLNCSRQSGKTTVTSIQALHAAIFRPKTLVLLLSPTLRQSSELFRNVLDYYGQLDSPISSETETVLKLELSNGSRIVSLPGKEQNVRGYAGVSLLIVDEAARVADDLYYSIRPMLAVSNGKLIALSTPWGKRGWWYQSWESQEPWERYEIPASKCPRISPNFLAEERRALGEWWYSQEYACQFMETENQLFSRDLIDQMLDNEIQPLFKQPEVNVDGKQNNSNLLDENIETLNLEMR